MVSSNETSHTVAELDIRAAKVGEDLDGEILRAGDQIRYTVDVCNLFTSSADTLDTIVDDGIPSRTTYVPESITLDGSPLTDQTGDDAGEYDGSRNRILVTVPRLGPGACAIITFDVVIDGQAATGTVIRNAARAEPDGGRGAEAWTEMVEMTVEGGSSLYDVLRGQLLNRVPADQSCPRAARQAPRLDPVQDLCVAPACTETVLGEVWQVDGDNLWSGATRLFYELTNVDCNRRLHVTKDRLASGQDLFLVLTP